MSIQVYHFSNIAKINLSNENIPHVFRWTVYVARQVGTDNDGNPLWESAGAVSTARVFTWLGGKSAPTPTP